MHVTASWGGPGGFLGDSALARIAEAVRHGCSAAPLPSDTHPLAQLVKVGVPGKHQQPGSYQLVASPGDTGEPRAGPVRGPVLVALVAVGAAPGTEA